MTPFTRRGFLRGTAVGLAGVSMSGWLGRLAADAPAKRAKSVILLWMQGGPATIDLWDLKPGAATGGPFQPIDTAAPGLRISEHLPRLAKLGKELCVVRSMSSKEGDHNRATHLLRTGYTPVGAIQFPAVGALVANEIGRDADLPNFVSIAPGRYATEIGGGFLGPAFTPLSIGKAEGSAADLRVPDLAPLPGTDGTARVGLLGELEKRTTAAGPVVDGLRASTDRARRLMTPAAAAAFRLSDEKDAVRDAYGRGVFGQGCLLARRLVERDVSFVEVTLDGWDTHQDNFERVKNLSTTLDAGFAALLADLKERGLLDSTLVVCQGEFGRTPKINGQTGRDHWPASWAVAMAGCGVTGGQAVGATNADGTAVEGKPASVPDLIATVVKAVGIDPRKQNDSNVGRPIRVADPSANVIEGVL